MAKLLFRSFVKQLDILLYKCYNFVVTRLHIILGLITILMDFNL